MATTDKEVLEDPGFIAIKLSPKGRVFGSLIYPLRNLTVQQQASLHVALQLASERVLEGNVAEALWPLGEALDLLGFTWERRDEH